MTTESWLSVNGHPVRKMLVNEGASGPWYADLELESLDEPLSGRVTIRAGETELSGTVDPTAGGTFALSSSVRVVGGGGGWGKVLERRGYNNDAGVRARALADDAARAAGEEIGTFEPATERVGAFYLRTVGAASITLEDAAGGVPWWVDRSGLTHVGQRSGSADPQRYQLVDFEPVSRIATLALDDLEAVTVGASLTDERLPSPLNVRELAITVSPDDIRAEAWLTSEDVTRARAASLLERLARKALGGKLFGKYRYRVVKMVGKRVNLQPVSSSSGAPDALSIHMAPGVAGSFSELERGAIVYVEFVEGERSDPLLCSFAGGKDPVSLELLEGGEDAARKGDTVEVLLPPMIFSGTIGGSPASGVLTSPTNKTLGAITRGSAKVKIG